MPTDATPATPIRRPRVTPEREIELLNVALDVMREVGYEALSMEVVATRARCSKATLYRQWNSKAGMIVAALHTVRPLHFDRVDTGTLRGDLLASAVRLASHAEKETALLSGLGHAILTDAALGQAMRTALLEPDAAHLMSLVDRAVDRGELPRRPGAAQFLPSLLTGAVISRPAFEGVFADADYLTRFTDTVLMPALLNS
ncbi:TetR/AcrR family transcriptional regulator [Streptomyces sp. NPDC087263]|uniref:TetR/AcrR family transcriptional regulator n=1 Tax=Streptomyces sp. NPDC087263 TaxID=3365773 RepID=UPI00381577AF